MSIDQQTEPSLPDLPGLPIDNNEPVFNEPWEAQAFGLAVALHQNGCFLWSEFSQALGDEINRARENGEPDQGNTYYQYWLAALEKLCSSKSMVNSDALRCRRDAWEQAYLNTPHGQPIELNSSS